MLGTRSARRLLALRGSASAAALPEIAAGLPLAGLGSHGCNLGRAAEVDHLPSGRTCGLAGGFLAACCSWAAQCAALHYCTALGCAANGAGARPPAVKPCRPVLPRSNGAQRRCAAAERSRAAAAAGQPAAAAAAQGHEQAPGAAGVVPYVLQAPAAQPALHRVCLQPRCACAGSRCNFCVELLSNWGL